MFHKALPASERYRLTDEQVRLISEGGDGLTGLENINGGLAWSDAVERVFPKARYFHKEGQISSYSLDVAYVDDAESGCRFILALAAASGDGTTIKQMARPIAEWIRNYAKNGYQTTNQKD
jgi:hypothetical protein